VYYSYVTSRRKKNTILVRAEPYSSVTANAMVWNTTIAFTISFLLFFHDTATTRASSIDDKQEIIVEKTTPSFYLKFAAGIIIMMQSTLIGVAGPCLGQWSN
jgi:hypothetical protein